MSDQTLDKLIAKLKIEAIDAAEKEANTIVAKAKAKAQKILNDAERKSSDLIHAAQKEANATLVKSEDAIKQAARDLTITLRNDLLNLLGNVLEKEVEAAFTAAIIETAVLKVIENVGSGVALKLPEELEANIANQIQKRFKDSPDITSVTNDNNLVNTFSIIKKEEGWSYDISPEEVANLLKTYLSPKWLHLLKSHTKA